MLMMMMMMNIIVIIIAIIIVIVVIIVIIIIVITSVISIYCMHVDPFVDRQHPGLQKHPALHRAAFGSGLILPVGGGFRLGPMGLGVLGAPIIKDEQPFRRSS